MSGVFDYSSDTVQLTANAAQVVVAKYDPNATSGKKFTVVPNVRVDRIVERKGLAPQVATFHYVLDGGNPDWPSQFEEVFALIAASGPGANPDASRSAARRRRYTISPEDRICVLVYRDAKDERDYQVYFDGYAEAPSVSANGKRQSLKFQATGVGIRLWDSPVTYRIERDASVPDIPGEGTRWQVDGRVVFNPDEKPNCTPDGADELVDPQDPKKGSYPIFLDPRLDGLPIKQTPWTLSKMARYLLGVYNDESFVSNPDFDLVKKILVNRQPRDGAATFNAGDPGTFTESEITLVEVEVSGQRWPDELESQLNFSGFAAKFEIGTDANGEPDNTIDIYREDGNGIDEPKDVFVQKSGGNIDPSVTNLSDIEINRDYRNTFNAVVVDTKAELVEVTIVLGLGFVPTQGDEANGNFTVFYKANLANGASGTARAKYRVYVADECGEGHWNVGSASWSLIPLDLSSVFEDDEGGNRTYCRRRRPGRRELITRDSSNRVLESQLWISSDYDGNAPAVWDGTGTWQPVTSGWKLLKDRLGIEITAEKPDAWNIGDYTGTDPQAGTTIVNAIASQSNPDDSSKRFFLRLTTVIEADGRPVGTIGRRPSSALKYDRVKYAHAKESFEFTRLAKGSQYNPSRLFDLPVVDESDKIRIHATQVQQAHENPAIGGRLVIPRLDRGYQIGDAIRAISGRDLSLQINAASEQNETRRYPTVIGREFEFTNRQETALILDDFSQDPR